MIEGDQGVLPRGFWPLLFGILLLKLLKTITFAQNQHRTSQAVQGAFILDLRCDCSDFVIFVTVLRLF